MAVNAEGAGQRPRDRGRRTSDHILNSVLDLLPTAVVVVDARGIVLSANPAARLMLAVHGGALRVTALVDLVRQVVEDGVPHEAVVTLPQRLEPPLRRPRRDREAPEARCVRCPWGVTAPSYSCLTMSPRSAASTPCGVISWPTSATN